MNLTKAFAGAAVGAIVGGPLPIVGSISGAVIGFAVGAGMSLNDKNKGPKN